MAGVLTRLQMANEILDNIGRASVAQARSGTTLATRVVTWLDRAQIRIARRESLLYQQSTASTVASTKDYGLPSNLRALFSIRLEDGLNSRKLKCVMPWQFDGWVPRPASLSTNVPEWYVPYRSCDSFELYPIPNSAYTMRLRFSYWPTALSTDAQTSDFSYMDDVLVYMATAEGFKWLQEINDAKYWEARGIEALADAVAAERDQFPDWVPTASGFSSGSDNIVGEYYNNPFIMGNP